MTEAETKEHEGRMTIDFSNVTVANLLAAKRKLEIGVAVTETTNEYTFTNAVPLRTINVSTATLTDALNCLAAVVTDLKAAGIFPP